GGAGRLLKRHDPRAGGAHRGAARDADVDARVAGLPRAPLAERRGDRAVDGPDELSGARLDRAGRQAGKPARRAVERALDLVLLGLEVGQPTLQRVAL